MGELQRGKRGVWGARLARLARLDMGLLRVAAYFTFAFACAGLAAGRVAAADLREATLSAGREIQKLSDLTAGAETLVVNGESLHRASAFTAQSPKEVLDRYEAYCDEAPGALGRAMKEIPEALHDKAFAKVPSRALRLGIVREEEGEHGMLACFVDDASSTRTLPERLRAMMETGNLSEVGKFRQVSVKRVDGGRTHVVTLWADGPMNVLKMFPAKGDAVGVDSPFLPRPEGARRILAGAAVGMPYGVWVYESTEPPARHWERYEAFLEEKGFKAAAAPEGTGTRTWLRGDDQLQVWVGVQPTKEGGAMVTLLTTGRADRYNGAAVEAAPSD